MACFKTAALLLLAVCVSGVYANDLILKFRVVDCLNNPVQNVKVTLEGCVDKLDNNNQPFSDLTDTNGLAVFNTPPGAVQYCYGSATGYCRWTATKDGKTYAGSIKTLMNRTASGQLVEVTPREASGCKCDGSDYCPKVIEYDADQSTKTVDPIQLKEQNCPTNPPSNSPSPSPSPNPPPPEKCPCECSFEVKVKRDSNPWDRNSGTEYTETVKGICSSNLKLTEKCGEKPERVCPRGYINSRQPCKSGKDCGVCCVAQTSLCAAKQNGKCNKYGGQCMCREISNGATCKTISFPNIIKAWEKKNRNPKCDDWGNMIDWWGKKIDWDEWKQGNWHNRKLQTFGYNWNWWDLWNLDGCEDNLCEAVAEKGGFDATCCAHYA